MTKEVSVYKSQQIMTKSPMRKQGNIAMTIWHNVETTSSLLFVEVIYLPFLFNEVHLLSVKNDWIFVVTMLPTSCTGLKFDLILFSSKI